ncbi:MAG: ribonuclease G [Alphaproteobacteria bacterium]
MKPGTIAIEVSPGETRAALIGEDQRLIEFFIDRMGQQSLIDGIYLGRVRHIERAQGGAFVEITNGITGFLSQSKSLTQGQSLVVQVVRDAAGDKGPTLSRRPAMRGRYITLRPDGRGVALDKGLGAGLAHAELEEFSPELDRDGFGIIVKPPAAFAEKEALREESDWLFTAWSEISEIADSASAPALLAPPPNGIVRILRDRAAKGEIIIDDREAFHETLTLVRDTMPDLYGLVRRHETPDPIFEAIGIADEVDTLGDRVVPLPGGGRLTIDALEALTAIDVDRGAASGGGSREDAILAFNITATKEAARQIRLRNVAGLILIDLLSIRHKAKKGVLVQAAKKAFRSDPTMTDVLGITSAGLLEITRRRTGAALSTWFNAPATTPRDASADACEALRTALREGGAKDLTLTAAPGIINQLEGPLKSALETVNRKLGRPLSLKSEHLKAGFEIQER